MDSSIKLHLEKFPGVMPPNPLYENIAHTKCALHTVACCVQEILCVHCVYISVQNNSLSKTFFRQKHCLSGHTDICMDKMTGQYLNQELLEIDDYIHNYKSFSTMYMSTQFYPCPSRKLCHALTVCQPIF